MIGRSVICGGHIDTGEAAIVPMEDAAIEQVAVKLVYIRNLDQVRALRPNVVPLHNDAEGKTALIPKKPILSVRLRQSLVDSYDGEPLSYNPVLAVQSRCKSWIDRITKSLWIILAALSVWIPQAIGKRGAVLRAGYNLGGKWRVRAVAGGIDGRKTVVSYPIARADHIVAPSPDIPCDTNSGREVQVIRVPALGNVLRTAVGDLLRQTRSRPVHEITQPVLRVRVRSIVFVAKSGVNRDVFAHLPVIRHPSAILRDSL